MNTVIVINRAGMGAGDVELGRKILKTFFTKAAGAFQDLEAIVFYNGGVRCLADADFAQALSTLDDRGVDLIACGTCVDAFELRDRLLVGEVGSMDRILQELEQAEKVITL